MKVGLSLDHAMFHNDRITMRIKRMPLLEHFPPIAQELTAFRERDFFEESVQVVLQQLGKFFIAHSVVVANMGNCLIYRVRPCDGDQPHDAASEIWVPKAELLKTVNRANDIRQRVFYGAFDPYTAIKEARILDGEYFTMGIYQLHPREDFDMTSVVIHVPPKPRRETFMDQLAYELSVFAVQEFTRSVQPGQEYHYKKSCAIAQVLLALPNKDSLLYPSVQHADRINLAIPEVVASERLTLASVLHCQLRGEAYALREARPIEGQPDQLKVVYQPPKGFRLNLLGEPMNFAKVFHHSAIAPPDEMLEHFKAKRPAVPKVDDRQG